MTSLREALPMGLLHYNEDHSTNQNHESVIKSPAKWPVDKYLSVAVWDRSQNNKPSSGTITSFKSRYRVPRSPGMKSNQRIFLFNGMQPSAKEKNRCLISPVLRWGVDGEGWSVISSFVNQLSGGESIAITTPSAPVEPGDLLTSAIRLEGKGTNYFRYSIEFEEFPQAKLVVQLDYQLIQVGIALEALDLQLCDNWPASVFTRFEDISVEVDGLNVKPDWDIRVQPIECNTRMVLSQDNADDKLVVVYQ